MAWKLKSTAFMEGEEIPGEYTCDGPDLSPLLQWTDPPEGTKGLALIMDDPDAPMGTWVHWVIYDLPANKRELPRGVPTKDTLQDGSKQGINDFRRIGYGGPCPPPGPVHRYFFKLYALDKRVELPAKATKSELLKTMEGHILGKTQLMGRYGR